MKEILITGEDGDRGTLLQSPFCTLMSTDVGEDPATSDDAAGPPSESVEGVFLGVVSRLQLRPTLMSRALAGTHLLQRYNEVEEEGYNLLCDSCEPMVKWNTD